MQMIDGRLIHSASDLNAFSECLHLIALERAAAAGKLARAARDDPTAELLARKGEEHELRHLEALRAAHGDRLVTFADRPAPTREAYEAAESETVAAMTRGVDVIYQATFFDGTFLGRADFLRRVDKKSARWQWSYEVIDTKLALSPKPYFLVQLCNYSEHVARIQGTNPEYTGIILGTGDERRFRVNDYAAYYRRLKASYLESVARGGDAYPFECAHCDFCAWRELCEQKRDADDHLGLVAGIRRDQIRKLESHGITTVAALGTSNRGECPPRLNRETYANLRAQAAEQHRHRTARAVDVSAPHSYTLRPVDDPKCGLARLPEPDAGDVFFDMEGDPLYRADRGLEYLFGVYLADERTYHAFWGKTPAEERDAFEALVDFVVARQLKYPNLHVYHYASYEMTALKRLMGRFGSREKQIDGFLRARTFVDLYPIVHQSVWISQPSYSIKKVEALYHFERKTVTRGGDDSIVMFESWLQSQDPEILEDIRAYNEDDCRSTFALREWLVRLRAELNATREPPVPWRSVPEDDRAPKNDDHGDLAAALLDGLPPPDTLEDLRTWAEAPRARWLLGNLLEYHRREQKPEWWEHFHRIDNPAELVDDPHCIGGLSLCAEIAPFKKGERDRNLVYTYCFPEQEHDLGAGGKPLDPASGKTVEIISCDDLTRTLELKLPKSLDPASLRALIPAAPLPDRNKRAGVEFIAAAYHDGRLEGEHPATIGILLNRTPQLHDRPAGARIQPPDVTNQGVSAVIAALARSHMIVQGPPGSGKTTRAAHAVVDLLVKKKRVALAAHSHKALHNLLHKVEEVAAERGFTFRGCHKSATQNPDSVYESLLEASLVEDSPHSDAFVGRELVSATTYAWADEEQRGKFDIVIVDEAGQVSLADALVTSLVARDVILLGDPQQLPHVSKGTHPIGTHGSVLEHILGEQQTIAGDRGVFLDRSYRMHPDIDHFVSHAFYDGKLEADAPNANNAVASPGLSGGGTRYLAVDHDENIRKSTEETDRVVGEIRRLLDGGTATIRDQAPRPLTPSDILVVAPYNLQRVAITARLRAHGLEKVAVGTVDKFQGLEAPVVFYSMATSRADLAPRGLDFLLSPNRLNVAVSRAQALSVVVCSPQLLSSRATTVDQMRLLSLLCAYVEDAEGQGVGGDSTLDLVGQGA